MEKTEYLFKVTVSKNTAHPNSDWVVWIKSTEDKIIEHLALILDEMSDPITSYENIERICRIDDIFTGGETGEV